MICDVLNNINVNGNIDAIYDKIYQKYSKKYTGYELNRIVEQKLYSLGFSREEINKKIVH